MNNLLVVNVPRPRNAVSDPSGFATLLLVAFLIWWVVRIIRKHTKKY